MGAGLGAALVGTRPIIEMRIFDFVMCAMDELVNQIAKVRYMFGGQAKPAVVVRMPHGMWRNSAAQHSQMLEAWFAHLPGVVVVTPATPADAAGLLVRRSAPTTRCCSSIRRTCSGSRARSPSRSSRSRSAWRARCAKATPRRSSPGRRRCRSPPGGRAAGRGGDRGRPPRPAHDLAVGRGRRGRFGAQDRTAAGGARGGRGRRLRRRSRRARGRSVGPGALKAAKRLAAPRIPVPFAPPLEAEVRITPEKVVKAVKGLL